MNICLVEPIGIPKKRVEKLAEDLIALGHDFTYYDSPITSSEDLAERSKNKDVIIIANTVFPGNIIEGNEHLKMISVAFTGIDHIGVQACKEKEIMICNAAGYANEAVAELVIGMTISAMRNLILADKIARTNKKNTISGREIFGKTVGIIGLGKIGLRTAKLFSAFGANVIAYNQSQSQEALELGITYKSLDEVLAQSDIISLHLPLTKETKGLISAEKIAMMKDNAILINCARGAIVDNDALVNALNNNQLGYACIDVFDMEPPIPADYPLLQAKNTLLTPHIGFDSEEAMLIRAEIAFDNVKNYFAGVPTNVCKL